MLKRGYKLIICVVLISALFIGFNVTSHAIHPATGGAALLGGALGSLGVDLLAGGGATAASLGLWLNGDFSIRGALTGVADGFIKVRDDSVIIDGVEYSSIFLDPSMAAVLHTQAFDFMTQKAITSNSSGTLASGVGSLFSVPIFSQNGRYISQIFSGNINSSFSVGDISFSNIFPYSASQPRIIQVFYQYPGISSQNSLINAGPSGTPSNLSIQLSNSRYGGGASTSFDIYIKPDTGSWGVLNGNALSGFISDPFNYSYVAGTIDADPLPADYGFEAFIPKSSIIQALINPGTYVIDGGAGLDTINDIISLLDEQYDNVKNADFVREETPPVPVPTTALGEVPYDTWIDTFGQSVYSKLDGLHNVIDIVGSAIESAIEAVEGAIDTAGQSVVTAVNNARTVFDTIGQSVITLLQGIRTAIGTATGTIVDAIEAVEAAVEGLAENIIEDIETAPINVFSTALDVIKVVFAPIIVALKACIGLWHYVVEWVQATAPVFSSFFGFMSGTSYNMVLPIYASLAGPIVIAVYKRFGK